MWTYEAERVVHAPPREAEPALVAVVDRVWRERARLVIQSASIGSVAAIDSEHADQGADVWLTWHLERVGQGTRVQLVLDEVDRGPDPEEGLEQVLDLVEQQLSLGSSGRRPGPGPVT